MLTSRLPIVGGRRQTESAAVNTLIASLSAQIVERGGPPLSSPLPTVNHNNDQWGPMIDAALIELSQQIVFLGGAPLTTLLPRVNGDNYKWGPIVIAVLTELSAEIDAIPIPEIIVHDFFLNAAAGGYAVTGSEGFFEWVALPFWDLAAGSYSISGADAINMATRVINATVGNYAISGADAFLDTSVSPDVILVTDANGDSLGFTLNDPGEDIIVTDDSGADLGITL